MPVLIPIAASPPHQKLLILEQRRGRTPQPGAPLGMEIQEMREESRNEGRIEGIKAFIQDKAEDGVAENIIIAKLQRHFALDEETAQKYYRTYGE